MSRVPGPILRTERLVLQTPKPRDVSAYYRIVRHPAVIRRIAWEGPRNRREIAESIPRMVARQRRGESVNYILHDAESYELLGGCGVRNLREGRDSGELAYWLGRPYWGKGFMPEALTALIGHCFGPLGLHRLYATVFTNNARSAAVLRNLGFQHEGRLRQLIKKRARYRDADQYSLLRTDPAARRLMRAVR